MPVQTSALEDLFRALPGILELPVTWLLVGLPVALVGVFVRRRRRARSDRAGGPDQP